MSSSLKLDKLINALQIMPGIGKRSATRIAYQLLERKRTEAIRLADVLQDAMQNIVYCKQCQNYSDHEFCDICQDIKRQDKRLLCVVETPSDMQAIEQGGNYFGLYFILHGHLSPIDGIGPQELRLDILEKLLAEHKFDELILATNPTVEGEATASYIAALAKKYEIVVSRLATGLPQGSDLDCIDEHTIAASLTYRRVLKDS